MLWQPTRGILQPNQNWRRPQTPGGGDSAAYTAFIARTSGLDGTHTSAYQALLNGMTDDGLFNSDGTTNYFDCLYIFATQDSTNAMLNLVSSSFNCTLNGSPTFTADRGYKPVAGGDYLETGFNPATATSPKYTQNNAHMSVWSNTSATTGYPSIGAGAGQHIYVRYVDNNNYLRINDSSDSGAYTFGSSVGHFIGYRNSSTNIGAYRNGTSGGTLSQSSKAVINGTIQVLRNPGAGNSGIDHQIAMASIGNDISGVANAFYTRLRTYMTAVGVP